MKIMVCDDEQAMAEEWLGEISNVAPDGLEIDFLTDPKSDVEVLSRRKKAIKEDNDFAAEPSIFDKIDILVVDYDLVLLDGDGSRTTGEGVARLARAYSSCGAIVVMNQYKGSQFDLGMRGHLESHADVNVDADLVGMAALWSIVEPTEKIFNPSIWTPVPMLLEAAVIFIEKLKAAGMDAPLMEVIGLDAAALAELSDSAYAFVDTKAQTAEQLAKLTLRTFLEGTLDDAVAVRIERQKPEFLYSFAAFRLRKWLDRSVLRPMDVLIDAPHLCERMPFLFDAEKVDIKTPEGWTAGLVRPPENLRQDILEKFVNKAASEILGKPVFNWYAIENDEAIDEMQEKHFEKHANRFSFAEDTSRFVVADQLTRYRADFHNFGDRRAIENVDGVRYGPLRRIKFG